MEEDRDERDEAVEDVHRGLGEEEEEGDDRDDDVELRRLGTPRMGWVKLDVVRGRVDAQDGIAVPSLVGAEFLESGPVQVRLGDCVEGEGGDDDRELEPDEAPEEPLVGSPSLGDEHHCECF